MRRKLKPITFFIVLVACLALLIIPMIIASQSSSHSVEKPKEKSVESASDQRISNLLAQMSLEEKVGQLFLARVPDTNQTEMIETYHLGGYMLFAKDYEGETLESTKEKISGYQKASNIPLLIASDEEGGTVTRISSLLDSPFKSPMSLYQEGGLPAIKEDTISKAQQLKAVGIDTGLFPVADVATDPNAFIYDRTIGEDAKVTSQYVSTVVKALSEQKFGSTLKHFPGYGNNGDTHTDIIYDNRSLKELKQTDLLPFEAGIKAGADSVLVSHNIVTAIDNVPASISSKVNQLLRKDLGFDGVVMTDDLDMAGLADFTSQEEAAYQAIKAGNDMVLSSSYESQIPYIVSKVKAGDLSEKQIDQSVKRILKWKDKLGLLSTTESEGK